jgi:hypothetical protein
MDPISEAYANNKQEYPLIPGASFEFTPIDEATKAKYQGQGDLYQAEKNTVGYIGAGDKMELEKELERLKARRAELAAKLESIHAAKGQTQETAAIRAKSYGIDTSGYDNAQTREMQGKKLEYDMKQQEKNEILNSYKNAAMNARIYGNQALQAMTSGFDTPEIQNAVKAHKAQEKTYIEQAQRLKDLGLKIGIPEEYFVLSVEAPVNNAGNDLTSEQKAQIAKDFMATQNSKPDTASLQLYLSKALPDAKISGAAFSEIFKHAEDSYNASIATADRKEQKEDRQETKKDKEYERKMKVFNDTFPNYSSLLNLDTKNKSTVASAISYFNSGNYKAVVDAVNGSLEEANSIGLNIPFAKVRIADNPTRDEAKAALMAFNAQIIAIRKEVNKAEAKKRELFGEK